MQIKLPEKANLIINALNDAGYEAYAVGGAVRDNLMGREADDFDITTSALPEETKIVFSSYPVLETGMKHGTVTVLIDHTPYEVTTYRAESAYSDSRHPDSVTFVNNLYEDLARRDFTMNAIAFSPNDGICDPFCGLNDINNKIIRSVGDPYLRFGEDALRILRALRFSAVLGFEIEEKTSNAILSLAETLNRISAERIYAEMKKLLCGKNVQAVIMRYLDVFKAILPINGAYGSLGKLPNDYKIRFYCLFGKSHAEALKKLRADNETKHICSLLDSSTPIPDDETKIKFYLSALGGVNAKTVIAYRRAMFSEDSENKASTLLNSSTPLFLQDLAVNGSDLVKIGIKGKKVGETLNMLLTAVIKNEVENGRESLIEFANKSKPHAQ